MHTYSHGHTYKHTGRVQLGPHNAHLWSNQAWISHSDSENDEMDEEEIVSPSGTIQRLDGTDDSVFKVLIESPGGTLYEVMKSPGGTRRRSPKKVKRVETPGGTQLVISPGGTRHVETPGGTRYMLSPRGTRYGEKEAIVSPGGTAKPQDKPLRVLKPSPTSKPPKSHAHSHFKGRVLDVAFRTVEESVIDPSKHVQMIARIQSQLPVTMLYEETYREDLCEPGKVFYKLKNIERCALGMQLESLSKLVFAIHLVKYSNFPYGMCSYQISSGTVSFKILHGNAVHNLFHAKFQDIACEDLEQIAECIQVFKTSKPEIRVIILRETWAMVTRKIRSIEHLHDFSHHHHHSSEYNTQAHKDVGSGNKNQALSNQIHPGPKRLERTASWEARMAIPPLLQDLAPPEPSPLKVNYPTLIALQIFLPQSTVSWQEHLPKNCD